MLTVHILSSYQSCSSVYNLFSTGIYVNNMLRLCSYFNFFKLITVLQKGSFLCQGLPSLWACWSWWQRCVRMHPTLVLVSSYSQSHTVSFLPSLVPYRVPIFSKATTTTKISWFNPYNQTEVLCCSSWYLGPADRGGDGNGRVEAESGGAGGRPLSPRHHRIIISRSTPSHYFLNFKLIHGVWSNVLNPGPVGSSSFWSDIP